MSGETPSQTNARISSRVQGGGSSWSDYSVGELWAIVKHRCADRHNRRNADPAYSMMETLGGEFDAQKAADVIAAVLTRDNRPLREDGMLTNGDLAAFLRLC
jgi:hypothetical protein